MKKLFLALFLVGSLTLSAKKVMFSVNMASWPVDTAGVHVTGDFQSEAGFATGDWDPGTTAMVQDVNDTNLYHVVVDIPAFRAYEFKFVNGNQGYQQEFVPLESRVNYNFIDNRWIYVDSLSNDTLDFGAIRFSGNAPAGKNLLRLYVDMQLQTVSTNGVHVGGDFQNWSANETQMYSFDGLVYEYITYVDSGMSTEREFRFLNGNTTGDYETLESWCQNGNGNRGVVAPRDTMLPAVCYTFCSACSTVGIDESTAAEFQMMPNPAEDYVTIQFASSGNWTVKVSDVSGREVVETGNVQQSSLQIETTSFPSGIYFVQVTDENGTAQVRKLIIQ